jgi:endonuclease-3
MAGDRKSPKTLNSRPERLPQDKSAPILKLLDQHYPEARCTLDYRTPLELLVATILSAQCTDERVNRVTPELFKKYPNADAYANVPLEELEADIRSTGFYHNKARSIQACCREILQNYSGEVPTQLEALVKLPGIGRKTANVILGNAFQIPGIVVDTHVGRVTHRLGLTSQKDPVKIEQDLMTLIPQQRWVHFSHQLIMHGRAICQARKPNCAICPLQSHCDFFLANSRSANSSDGRA